MRWSRRDRDKDPVQLGQKERRSCSGSRPDPLRLSFGCVGPALNEAFAAGDVNSHATRVIKDVVRVTARRHGPAEDSVKAVAQQHRWLARGDDDAVGLE